MRAAAGLLLAVAMGLAWAQPAGAHAFLVQSSPQAGERVSAPPQTISLRFTEHVANPKVELKRADGAALKEGRVAVQNDGMTVSVPVSRSLADGIYVVSWHVVSTDDGHETVGEFAFAVGGSGAIRTLAANGGSSIDWGQAVVRWVLLLSLLLAFGASVSGRFLWKPDTTSRSVVLPRPPLGPLLIAAATGGLGQLALLVWRSGSPSGWGAAVLGSRPGLVALWTLVLIVVALWTTTMLRWARAWLFVPIGLALVIAGLGGHPGAAPQWWAAPANALHLLAVGVWIGGLGHALLMLWWHRSEGDARQVVRQGLRRYSAAALIAVPVALLAGAPVALSQFTAVDQLITTTYGNLLLAKAALITVALAAAWLARRRLLSPTPNPRLDSVRRRAGLEGALLASAVVVAVVLASAPPPTQPAAAEDLLGPPPLQAPVLRHADLSGSLAVFLSAAPDRLRVQVVAPSDKPARIRRIEIEGNAPDGHGFTIQTRSCGPGCATAAFSWPRGTSALTVAVEAEDRRWSGGNVHFSVTWPPQPEDQALVTRVLAVMRAQPRLEMVERVSSGKGDAAERTYTMTGRQFVPLELYAKGGAQDVHPVALPGGGRGVTLYLPGSSIWYLLELDSADRIQKETIVDPGHLIERTFTYPPA